MAGVLGSGSGGSLNTVPALVLGSGSGGPLNTVPALVLGAGTGGVLEALPIMPGDRHVWDGKTQKEYIDGLLGATKGYLVYAGQDGVSGTISAQRDAPSYSGDFEGYWKVVSTSAGATLSVVFAGRLGPSQTTITSLKIPIKGVGASPQYTIRVYVDGQGAVDQFGEGIQTAPGTLTERSLVDTDFSNQPTGAKKRFFIDILATLDSGEELYIGRPYFEQE